MFFENWQLEIKENYNFINGVKCREALYHRKRDKRGKRKRFSC